MKSIRLNDVLFWMIILMIVATALWLLSGSPPETNALISIALFVAASEILLWKTLFVIDKKTSTGFERVKSRFDKIDYNINEIKLLIKK